MPMPDPSAPETAAPRRWLSIVGIGEDGVDGLSPAARSLIAGAEIVFGGKRHLELAGPLIRGVLRPWPSPFDSGLQAVVSERGRQVCVLASGDPSFYGIGPLLARHVAPDETVVLPAPSSFSLAAARLGWALADTVLLSLHGRPLDLLRPHLHPGARILALTADGASPKAVAALLAASGFGKSRLTVLEALGGPRERIASALAEKFPGGDVDALNIVAIEVEASPGAKILSLAAGLPDSLYEHDGQITKREIRAMTLSCLAPRRGELLWDIGAGSGSVAIEWMLADPSLRAIAIEADAERSARVVRNSASFGVPGLEVICGRAPDALRGLRQPDAVFIGGGAGEPGLLDAVIAALRSGGRLAINAVTLETESLLIARHAALGGELVRVAVSRAAAVGGKTGWRPAMPVTQWAWTKP